MAAAGVEAGASAAGYGVSLGASTIGGGGSSGLFGGSDSGGDVDTDAPTQPKLGRQQQQQRQPVAAVAAVAGVAGGLEGREIWTDEDEALATGSSSGTFVNLLANPEGYTGYTGPGARRIWEAVYEENCFRGGGEVPEGASGAAAATAAGLATASASARNLFNRGRGDGDNLQCYEERVFYRLLSGLQTSINTHIAMTYGYGVGSDKAAEAGGHGGATEGAANEEAADPLGLPSDLFYDARYDVGVLHPLRWACEHAFAPALLREKTSRLRKANKPSGVGANDTMLQRLFVQHLLPRCQDHFLALHQRGQLSALPQPWFRLRFGWLGQRIADLFLAASPHVSAFGQRLQAWFSPASSSSASASAPAASSSEAKETPPPVPPHLVLTPGVRPSLEVYLDRIGRHPDRVRNLYFAYLFAVRALVKARPLLAAGSLSYLSTGNATEDEATRQLLRRLVNIEAPHVLSDGFDEATMFQAQGSSIPGGSLFAPPAASHHGSHGSASSVASVSSTGASATAESVANGDLARLLEKTGGAETASTTCATDAATGAAATDSGSASSQRASAAATGSASSSAGLSAPESPAYYAALDSQQLLQDSAAHKAFLRRAWREKYRNISRIMDCVGCEKCRLWGKLQFLGIGTAMKILFADSSASSGLVPVQRSPESQFPTEPATDAGPTPQFVSAPGLAGLRLTRNELVAFVNVLHRLSMSVQAVHVFRDIEVLVKLHALTTKVGVAAIGILLVTLLGLYLRKCALRVASRRAFKGQNAKRGPDVDSKNHAKYE
jgi:hypothetical protein